MTIAVEDMVHREVHYCVSSLVHTLDNGMGYVSLIDGSREECNLNDLTHQAFELTAPIDDWEEAAREAGWVYDEQSERWTENDSPEREGSAVAYESAQELCESESIEPYQREVYEHWIVSDWFADKLAAKGEKVDKDFAGMTVWARTATGQAISMDSVIQAIHADLIRPE